ncbi:DUF2922 family protein [Enterococcus sp.]|uniref:DUF2922 family protein n=1 Tax=Enterococcus sp. TaxID=35783 RepID=UPI002908121E|nr:DUF2922 family protein [Enterococcus sp.]MDU5333076.1 DUF2922 family protein [Enterococcus sp.]
MLKIVATFKNSFGKNHTWSFKDPNTLKTDTEIKGLLEQMTDVKLCQKDGAEMFHTVETAKYVETTERIIF